MNNIKKIMAAICFSPYCEGTFTLAVDLASKFDAKLIVANVINIREVEAVSFVESMGYNVRSVQYIEEVERERIKTLEKMVDDSGFPRERVKIIFRVGHPFEELMKVIREEDVDCVVVGSKGRTNLEHMLVGSVSDKLFRHSPVTVVSHRRERTATTIEKKNATET